MRKFQILILFVALSARADLGSERFNCSGTASTGESVVLQGTFKGMPEPYAMVPGEITGSVGPGSFHDTVTFIRGEWSSPVIQLRVVRNSNPEQGLSFYSRDFFDESKPTHAATLGLKGESIAVSCQRVPPPCGCQISGCHHPLEYCDAGSGPDGCGYQCYRMSW